MGSIPFAIALKGFQQLEYLAAEQLTLSQRHGVSLETDIVAQVATIVLIQPSLVSDKNDSLGQNLISFLPHLVGRFGLALNDFLKSWTISELSHKLCLYILRPKTVDVTPAAQSRERHIIQIK